MRRNTLNVTLVTVLLATCVISTNAYPADGMAFKAFAAAWAIAVIANNWPRPQRTKRSKTSVL